jgi:hypothetical protein
MPLGRCSNDWPISQSPRVDHVTETITTVAGGTGDETDGLLRRSKHLTHGRILLASLTAAGRRALEPGRALGLAVQDRVLAGLAASDRQTLVRLLQAIEQRSAEI